MMKLIKNQFAKLNKYPRLRVLVFVIIGLVVIALFVRMFSGHVTNSVPPSNIGKPSVVLSQHALTGTAQYQQLAQQQQQNQVQQASQTGQTYFSNVFPNGANVSSASAADSPDGVALQPGVAPSISPNPAYNASTTGGNSTLAQNALNQSGATQAFAGPQPNAYDRLVTEPNAAQNQAQYQQMQNQALAAIPNPNNPNAYQLAPGGVGQPASGTDPVTFYQQQQMAQQAQPAYAANLQNVNAMASSMNQQLQNLSGDWKMPTGKMVQGTTPKGPAASSSATTVQGPVMIKAGTIYYAVLQTALNSDQPGTPVMAQIVQGPYNGAKLLGSFQLEGTKLVVVFNTMSLPNQDSSITVGKAYAIDGQTAQNALASNVDNHYLLRYGSLFAAGFLQGYGNAYASQNYNGGCSPSNSTCIVIGGSNQSSMPAAQSAFYQGLGQVGTNLSAVMMQNFNTPPTVTLDQGTGLGILFMQDVRQQ